MDGKQKKKTEKRVTEDIKDTISEVLVKNKQRLEEELDTLTGKQFVDKYIDLLKYVIPSMSSQKVDTNQAPPVTLVFSPIQSRDQLMDVNAIPIDSLQDGYKDDPV